MENRGFRTRILTTLGFVLIYRLGSFVTLPGVDPTQLQLLENQTSDGLLGLLNLFTEGAFSQASIMALGICLIFQHRLLFSYWE